MFKVFKRNISLAYLTVPDLSPLKAVKIAADVGFTHVGLRMLPALENEFLYPLLGNKKILRKVKSYLNETGLQIGDVELIRLKPSINIEDYRLFFESANYLGAHDITVLSDDPSLARVISNFGKLCELAIQYDIYLNLEAIPWTHLNRVETSIDIVNSINMNNACVLIDAFHFHRCGAKVECLDKLSPKKFRVLQICDAPLDFSPDPDAIRHEARTARLMPGLGMLNLNELLIKIDESTLISVEVPNSELIKTLSPEERAVQALSSTSNLLSKLSHG